MGLPLVTKSEFKTYVGLTSTSQDAIIDSLIPKVSELVKSICGRTFVDYVNDAKTEYLLGGAKFMNVSEPPITAISSLEYSSDYGASYTTLTEYTDFVWNRRDDTIISLTGLDFDSKPNAYRITYTGGYETLPPDLRLATLDLVNYYLRNDMAVHSTRSQGSNTVQIEYVINTNLPAHIKRVLDLYTLSFM